MSVKNVLVVIIGFIYLNLVGCENDSNPTAAPTLALVVSSVVVDENENATVSVDQGEIIGVKISYPSSVSASSEQRFTVDNADLTLTFLPTPTSLGNECIISSGQSSCTVLARVAAENFTGSYQFTYSPDSENTAVLSTTGNTFELLGDKWRSVSTGTNGSCGITGAGGLYCWGAGSAGGLGNGSNGFSNVPVAVGGVTEPDLFTRGTKAVSVGADHACALTEASALYCWGNNFSGELGNGTNTNSNVPVEVGSGTTAGLFSSGVVSFIAAFRNTCAIVSTGKLYCWGSNLDGQVGDGSTSNRNAPVEVGSGATAGLFSSGTQAVTVNASYLQSNVYQHHTCAIASTGRLYCWGSNRNGQLGDGSTTNSDVPQAVVGALSVVAVTTGGKHSCAITSGGELNCWGDNSEGQLGDGSFTDSNLPVAVGSGATATLFSSGTETVSAGANNTCAIDSAGKLYCWGDNGAGRLGAGSAVADSNVPLGVIGSGADATLFSSGVKTVNSQGNNHRCAIPSTGELYCWGIGQSGRLGNGSTTSFSFPELVVDPI